MTVYERFDGVQSPDIDCLGCADRSGTLDSSRIRIYDHPSFIVNQDYETPIPGFVIISSRDHVSSIDELTEIQAADLGRLQHYVRKGMREVLGLNTVSVFQNEQGAQHFHIWMMPRYGWIEEYGTSANSLIPAIKHAKTHLKTEITIDAIDVCVSQLRDYMRNYFPIEIDGESWEDFIQRISDKDYTCPEQHSS